MSKSNKAVGMPKSKGSRQKLRRWTFAAQIKLESGQVVGSKMPGVVYGNSAEANAVAKELQAKYGQTEGASQGMEVVPISHETVSLDTKRQLEGLNDNANLAFKSAYILAERLKIAMGLEETEHQIVTGAVEQARKHLFPRLDKANEKVAELEAQTAVQEIDNGGDGFNESPKPKRKIGIDAVNEILAAPAE